MEPDNDPYKIQWITDQLSKGQTQREIGRQLGITRQAISIRLSRNGINTREIRRSVGRSKAESRKFEEFARRAANAVPCILCGYWVLRRGQGQFRTCSPECGHAVSSTARYILVDEARRKHQILVARWKLNHPEIDRGSLQWAQRVINGLPTKSHGRWYIPGSKVSERIRRIAPDKLPPPPKGYSKNAT